jgi:heme exporter protein CcmD
MSIDWSAFWQLGGHGVFVWPGYAAAALLVVVEAMVLLRRLRAQDAESKA